MSKESDQARAVLRADLIEISAKAKRRAAYITEKTKQYNSPIAEVLKIRLIDAMNETERLCFAICDAFDNIDKVNAVASIHKRQSDVKNVRDAVERLLDLRRKYYQASARYGEVEQAYTDYAVQQGAVFLYEGLD
jgi:hypothetical protein